MALDNVDSIHYKLIVTGSHLLEKFGTTIESIKKDNLSGEIIQFAAFEENSSPGLIEFNTVSENISTICENEKPHYVFITGDRIEAYACAIGAHFSKTNIIHYGGGNISKGSWDDIYRYNISNLAKYHFVTNEVASENLKQVPSLLDKNEIYNIGSFSVDYLLDFKVKKDNPPYSNSFALMTFHPSQKLDENIAEIMDQTIDYLLSRKMSIVITYPNTDPGFEKIVSVINKQNDSNVTIHKNLGSDQFYSHLKQAKLIIGNSSSSFVEAPYFGNPILNIGKRQDGRISDKIISHCDLNIESIKAWIDQQRSCNFEKKNCEQLFGKGNSINLAVDLLNRLSNECKHR